MVGNVKGSNQKKDGSRDERMSQIEAEMEERKKFGFKLQMRTENGKLDLRRET